MVITQHGRGVAVLMDAKCYTEMQEHLELLEELLNAEEEISAGRGVPHDVARARGTKAIRQGVIL